MSTKKFEGFDIPAFTAGDKKGEFPNNPGKFYYFENATREAWREYVQLLKAEGFVPYFENKITDNEFATLTNDAYTVHTYYTAYSGTVRVIVEEKGELLPTEPEELDERLCEASVTQLALNYGKDPKDVQKSLAENDGGMSYIITLEDSTFIIIDGGVALIEGNRLKNVEHLMQKLKYLNKRPDGRIIINAWYITHAHIDHFWTYECFSKTYGKKVTLGKVIYNIPSSEVLGNMLRQDTPFPIWSSDGRAARASADNFSPDVKIYKPHSGQVFYIKNVKFETLYTYEDLYPNRMEVNCNDSSMTSRMTLSGQTVIWSGDVYTANTFIKHEPPLEFCGCEVMVAMYGDYLKSDIVQMPHHGYATSGGPAWYKCIGAKIALWSQGFIWINLNKKQSDEVRRWLREAGTGIVIYADPDDVTLSFPCV